MQVLFFKIFHRLFTFHPITWTTRSRFLKKQMDLVEKFRKEISDVCRFLFAASYATSSSSSSLTDEKIYQDSVIMVYLNGLSGLFNPVRCDLENDSDDNAQDLVCSGEQSAFARKVIAATFQDPSTNPLKLGLFYQEGVIPFDFDEMLFEAFQSLYATYKKASLDGKESDTGTEEVLLALNKRKPMDTLEECLQLSRNMVSRWPNVFRNNVVILNRKRYLYPLNDTGYPVLPLGLQEPFKRVSRVEYAHPDLPEGLQQQPCKHATQNQDAQSGSRDKEKTPSANVESNDEPHEQSDLISGQKDQIAAPEPKASEPIAETKNKESVPDTRPYVYVLNDYELFREESLDGYWGDDDYFPLLKETEIQHHQNAESFKKNQLIREFIPDMFLHLCAQNDLSSLWPNLETLILSNDEAIWEGPSFTLPNRLKELTVSFSNPQDILKNKRFVKAAKNGRVYERIQNLILFDPERCWAVLPEDKDDNPENAQENVNPSPKPFDIRNLTLLSVTCSNVSFTPAHFGANLSSLHLERCDNLPRILDLGNSPVLETVSVILCKPVVAVVGTNYAKKIKVIFHFDSINSLVDQYEKDPDVCGRPGFTPLTLDALESLPFRSAKRLFVDYMEDVFAWAGMPTVLSVDEKQTFRNSKALYLVDCKIGRQFYSDKFVDEKGSVQSQYNLAMEMYEKGSFRYYQLPDLQNVLSLETNTHRYNLNWTREKWNCDVKRILASPEYGNGLCRFEGFGTTHTKVHIPFAFNPYPFKFHEWARACMY